MKDTVSVEADGSRMLIYRQNKLVNPSDISKFAGEAARIARLFADERGIF